MVTSGSSWEYIVEPFTLPSTFSPSSSGNPGVPLSPRGKTTNPITPPANAPPVPGPSNPADQSGRNPIVYVVHDDSGRAPVTVYTEGGAVLVELPPQYAAGSTGTPLENDESREVDRRRGVRRSTVTPQKIQEPRSS